jgi:hypothetical protein
MLVSTTVSKRHLTKRTWRYGPRFTLSRGSGQAPGLVGWWIWDNAEGSYVAGPIGSQARAGAEVRSRNERAGFGAVVNRVPPPPEPIGVATSPRREPIGRAVPLLVLRIAPGPTSERSTTLVVRRARRKRSVPPLATKVIITAPGSDPLEAVVMSAAPTGADELALVLEGVSSAEVPANALLTWWA